MTQSNVQEKTKNNFDSLEEVAERLKEDNKKVTLLYAFNGTGKTRLSMYFKDLINEGRDEDDPKRIVYYNAFTEDLFYWDNDLDNHTERKLQINMHSNFITFITGSGKEKDIANKFQELTSSKIEPNIDTTTGQVTFTLPSGDEDAVDNIKISKGEESIFIWAVFNVFMEEIIETLNADEIDDRNTEEFNDIEYIFIDDPMSSLDDNHVIDVAVHMHQLIASSQSPKLKFIISTHHALFYNVLHNEFKHDKDIKKKVFYVLHKKEMAYFLRKQNDSPFGYHHVVKDKLKRAIEEDTIEKYHFGLFRNLLEKTATYLGYKDWGDLLVDSDMTELERAGVIRKINLHSHNKHADLDYDELVPADKELLKLHFTNFVQEYKWRVVGDE